MRNWDQRVNASKQQKKTAARRKCPRCERGNALVYMRSVDGAVYGRKCRWCDYERLAATGL